MPNWCNNKITICSTDAELLNRIKTALENEKFFQEFFPVPEDKTDTANPFMSDVEYNWRTNNWGTKWDVSNVSVVEYSSSIEATFDTAWAPPTGVYNKLVELGIDLYASYYEPNMGFAGTYSQGVDTCIEFASSDVLDVLPLTLIRDFNIEDDCVDEFED